MAVLGISEDHYAKLCALIDLKRDLDEAQEKINASAPTLFKTLISNRGITQRELSEILEVDYTYISKIVRGVQPPGLPVWEKLHTYLVR